MSDKINNSSDKKDQLLSKDTPKGNEPVKQKYRFPINNSSTLTSPVVNEIPLVQQNNEICTSKYNFITAIPKILIEQFSHIGNIYFLFLAILQIFPDFSQSGGSPILLIPLILVVGVNGTKDFIEDYERKRSDQRENEATTYVISPIEGIRQTKWKDIKPGDIVKINKNEYFPADLLLVYSTNKNGATFVETKNLDGETNLKYKECVKDLYKVFPTENNPVVEEKKVVDIVTNLDCFIDCHIPFANLYEFDGVLYQDQNVNRKLHGEEHDFINNKPESEPAINPETEIGEKEEKKENLINEDNKNELKEKIIPVINYSNNAAEPYQPPRKDAEVYSVSVIDSNNLLLRGSSLRNTDYIIGIVTYAGHSSKIMLNSLNARSKQSKVTYRMNWTLKIIVLLQMTISLIFGIIQFVLYDDYEPIRKIKRQNIFFNFLSWILAINNLVPISLLVTMEMIRFLQAYFMGYDCKMYDHANKRFTVIQSSGLNEELGQIHYIFTDKTGTLTKNVMQFKAMVIGKNSYGTDAHAKAEILQQRGVSNCDFDDSNFDQDWSSGDEKTREEIRKYIFALALCHTVITEEDLKNPGNINYNASSPDELALVNAAKYFGVELKERNADSILTVIFEGKPLKYKLLHVFEFNSDRKRMSVLIKDLQNQTYEIITKGADSSISPRLDINAGNNKENLDYTLDQLARFGRKGLRTLLVASREVPKEEYKEFKKEYRMAITIEDPKEKAEVLDKLYENIETRFNLLGATAIEDCLQDHLPETLSAFAEIGIKIFMLTGDHPLTAISIAHSSGLITEDIVPIIIDTKDFGEINKSLLECVDKSQKDKTCLVITGNALLEVAKRIEKKDSLYTVFQLCLNVTHSVICSRVSPKQKAEIVKLVKALDKSKTTLAIGDGANDVNMINVADVGIGIYGNEGQQAARASDYAIGEFHFLKRLVFVHGREAYRKNSFAVSYVLWKNFLYTTPIIVFGFFSRFTGQLFYDPLMDALYNVIFTALPVGWFAISDKETEYSFLESTPLKYKRGMKNKLFNAYTIFTWYCYAFLAGLIIFLMHYNVLCYTFLYYDYRGYDLWTVGASMMTCIVVVVNCKLIFETHTHTIYTALLIVFSIGAYIIVFIIGNFNLFFDTWRIYNVLNMLMRSADFWLMLFLTVLSYLVIEYGWRAIKFYLKKAKVLARKAREKLKKFNEKYIKKGIKKLEPIEIDPDLKDKEFVVKFDENDYRGFAFSEDVANLGIIQNNIQEGDSSRTESQLIENEIPG